jgi:hypothetical protein
MKKRRTWIIAAALLVAVLGWLAFIVLKPSQIKSEAEIKTAAPSPLPQNPVPSQQPNTTPDLSIYKTDPKWIWWNEQIERDPKFEWRMPISFYGKVVDQNNQPIQGVEIVFQWTDLSEKGTTEKTVFSGGDGRFDLTQVTGKNLGIIRMFKEGYYRVQQGTQVSFEYAAFFEPTFHQPDAKNPVVFRLRKAGEIPAELVARETMMGIEPSGKPHYIDLETTRKSNEAQADIAIRITRTAPKQQARYDWSASIEGVNGAGLIESDEEFMFEAPQDGYKPAYTYQFKEGSPDWENNLKRKYFVTAEGGKIYGRLEVEFFPKYQNTAAIAVRFFVNPTGSRNLEYAPHKVLSR